MAESFHKLLDQIILFLPRLITGLLIFIGFWLLAILVEKIVKRLIRRVVSYHDIQLILQRGIKGTILAIGIATSLGTIGINISAMIAGLGLTGFALGFAFKDMLSNTLAGILIIINRPFINGDYINTSGLEGKVIEINLRYVILKTDSKKILIPSSNLLINPITIFDHSPLDEKIEQKQESPLRSLKA